MINANIDLIYNKQLMLIYIYLYRERNIRWENIFSNDNNNINENWSAATV